MLGHPAGGPDFFVVGGAYCSSFLVLPFFGFVGPVSIATFGCVGVCRSLHKGWEFVAVRPLRLRLPFGAA